MSRWLRLGRQLLMVVAGLLYTLLLLKAAISNSSRELSIALAMVPVALFLLYLAWGSRHRYPLLLMLLVVGGLIWLKWGETLMGHYLWFYLLQHVGVYAGLAIFFGRTLLAGSTPLVSRFAAIVHGELNPKQLRYTRQVTTAWALFFTANALLSIILFLFDSVEHWAIFANIISPLLIGLMFAAEHLVRHQQLPDMQHANIIETIRVSSKYLREQQKARS